MILKQRVNIYFFGKQMKSDLEDEELRNNFHKILRNWLKNLR